MKNPNRVLVSEDTNVWQGIFARIVADQPFALVQAYDLKTTLEAIDEHFFNVVIVDLSLDPKDESRLDGIETMRTLQATNEGTQAIVLTGKGTVDLAVRALREFNVYHFLQKETFDDAAFLQLLKDASARAFRDAIAPGRFPPPEVLLGEVDWHRFASALGTPQDDVKALFCALIRECMPVRFSGTVLRAGIDPGTHTLRAECWSRWFGQSVRIAVGGAEAVSVNESGDIERRHLDKTHGAITATQRSYESFGA